MLFASIFVSWVRLQELLWLVPYIKGILIQRSSGSTGLLEGGFECLQLLQALQGARVEKNGSG